MPLPTYSPMLAGRGVATGDGWVFEPKWDGWRVLVYVEDGRVRVRTRRGRDVTASLPELAGLAEAVNGRRVVLDGELVASRGGRLAFHALARRMAATTPTAVARAREAVDVALVCFDVLYADEDVTGLRLVERKAILRSFALAGPCWRATPTCDDGDLLLAWAEAEGLEGIVAKRLDSAYRPGRRSPHWRKRKTQRWLSDEGPRRMAAFARPAS